MTFKCGTPAMLSYIAFVTDCCSASFHNFDQQRTRSRFCSNLSNRHIKICMLPPATESHLCAFPRKVAHLFAGVPRSSI